MTKKTKKVMTRFCFVFTLLTLVGSYCLNYAKTETLPISSEYTFTLSAEQEDLPDGYSRLEIENFLCAVAENYISAENIARHSYSGNYYILARETLHLQKKNAEACEIYKWFEDHVTVTSKGNLSELEHITIRKFYNHINQIIGQEKFVYNPQLPVANIVIELAEQDSAQEEHHYLGETSLLQDNLRTRLGIKDSKVYLDIYTMGEAPITVDSRQIIFTPEELEFRKTNRLVKVHLGMVMDPRMRHFALVHELFHTLGYSGHSPYLESFLFPFPVDPYKEVLPNLEVEDIRFTPLAERMVEMLYRPEILPGMSLKQSALLLPRLKIRAKTTKAETIACLKKLAVEMEDKKQQHLTQGKDNYDRIMDILILQDKLDLKELGLLKELKEIKDDYKLPAQIVQWIKDAKNPLEKVLHIRRELIVQEYHEKRLVAILAGFKSNPPAKIKSQLKIHKIQVVVLQDILALQKDIDDAEEKLVTSRSAQNTYQLEESLRRVERQLMTIKRLMDNG